MRDFRKLEIWKNGIEIVKLIYKLSHKLPTEEKLKIAKGQRPEANSPI